MHHLLALRIGPIPHQRKDDINVCTAMEEELLNALFAMAGVVDTIPTTPLINGASVFPATGLACNLAHYAMAWDIVNIRKREEIAF